MEQHVSGGEGARELSAAPLKDRRLPKPLRFHSAVENNAVFSAGLKLEREGRRGVAVLCRRVATERRFN